MAQMIGQDHDSLRNYTGFGVRLLSFKIMLKLITYKSQHSIEPLYGIHKLDAIRDYLLGKDPKDVSGERTETVGAQVVMQL